MLKDIILLYKYRKFRVLGKALAEFICRSLGKKEELWKGVEVVVSVPLHPKRRRERGFNQAEVIADQLAKKKGIECTHRALIKIRNTLPQTSLLAEERRKNVKGAMGIREKEKIAGKTVLLVDDVYTTGATMGECSVALKRGGAKEVRALTLAQA
ncbi:MAG: ComF family protein [Candidatus Aminicenantes bacterium]